MLLSSCDLYDSGYLSDRVIDHVVLIRADARDVPGDGGESFLPGWVVVSSFQHRVLTVNVLSTDKLARRMVQCLTAASWVTLYE